MNTTQTSIARIYVASLSHYNAGHLVGEWIELSPWWNGADVMDEIRSVLDRAEEAGPDVSGPVEEYAVHDFEGFPRSLYHEYMSAQAFDKLTTFLRLRDEYGEAFGAYVDYFGDEIDPDEWKRDFYDRYVGTYEDREAYGWHIADMYDVPDALEHYIDAEAIARDAEYGGDVTFQRTAEGLAAFRTH